MIFGDRELFPSHRAGTTVSSALRSVARGSLRGRMAHKILSYSGGELLQTGADVAIQGLNDVGHRLALNRFIVRIGLGPDSRATCWIEELQLEREASHQFRLVHPIHREQMAAHDVIAASAAGNARHGAVLS